MKILLVTVLLGLSNFAFASSPILDGTWTTGYVVGHGKVSVIVEGSRVSLINDQNSCNLNAIGEPAACTRMRAIATPTAFELDQKTSGTQPKGILVYKLVGTDFGVVVAKNPRENWVRLLEYEKDRVVYAMTLTKE